MERQKFSSWSDWQMRQNAVGGEGGHGAAKPHAVIHRYVLKHYRRINLLMFNVLI